MARTTPGCCEFANSVRSSGEKFGPVISESLRLRAKNDHEPSEATVTRWFAPSPSSLAMRPPYGLTVRLSGPSTSAS